MNVLTMFNSRRLVVCNCNSEHYRTKFYFGIWCQNKVIIIIIIKKRNERKEIRNHGLLQSNKYNDFVLSWRNNATTSRHQRRQCVGRRRIRDGVPSLVSRAFYR